MSYAEFARRLNVERTTVYNIVRSKSIDVERLIRISQILEYDFLSRVYLGKEDCSDNCIDIKLDSNSLRHMSEGSILTLRISIEE